jgi:hypothetical protein
MQIKLWLCYPPISSWFLAFSVRAVVGTSDLRRKPIISSSYVGLYGLSTWGRPWSILSIGPAAEEGDGPIVGCRRVRMTRRTEIRHVANPPFLIARVLSGEHDRLHG